jgi:deoxyribodipyrimidine photo-lyase
MDLPVNVFWFRRDLRLHDNAGLYHALKQGKPVVPIFIFDRNILDELEDRTDRRVEFIHNALRDIQKELSMFGSTLDVRYGFPGEIWQQLIKDYTIEKCLYKS